MRSYEIFSARKRLMTRLADGLLAPLGALKIPQSTASRPAPRQVARLLVMRTAYLGDVAMALPALRAVRALYRDAEIWFATSRAGRDLVAPEGVCDRVLVVEPPWFYPRAPESSWRALGRAVAELRRARFDLAVELRGDLREIALILAPSGARWRVSYDYAGGGPLLSEVVPFRGRAHKVDLMLDVARFLGATGAVAEFGLAPRAESARRVAARLAAAGVDRPYLLVHPGTRVALKEYPQLGELAARLPAMVGEALAVVVADARGIGAGPGVHALAGELSVDELVELVRGARLLLGHDSAPWHLAQAVGTPAIALFGPSKPWATGLYAGRSGLALSADLPCRDLCEENVCRLAPVRGQCLRDLEPARVAAAVMTLLHQTVVPTC